MGISIMKTLLIFFALISMIVVQVGAAARNGVTYIHPGVLDPCKRPGGPYSGYDPNRNSAPTQANTYNCGCSGHHRCPH
ncbi:hypothetical protein E1A91_D12G083500v1 [Gossypium mustelinum]|uniref:Uncharacterized protein n=1 Tax=Gossypium mustelinum TaxID=34275 RepID=A0A5D2SAU6_GOSMU|nr:hypothetical protein E1A91_D12G083500v1 [Gossypium mustelinum]